MAGRRAPGSARHHPFPTRRGWIFFAVGVVALAGSATFARSDLLFAGLFLVAVPTASMLSLTIVRPRLTVVRTIAPAAVAVGSVATVTLSVQNRAARASRAAAWREVVSPGVRSAAAGTLPALAEHPPAWRGDSDRVAVRYRLLAERRGRHPVGPFVLELVDPFGLAAVENEIGRQGEIVVTPTWFALEPTRYSRPTVGVERLQVRSAAPSPDEVLTREYRAGDALRRVNWKSTARHDALMVRQEEQRSESTAWIVLDSGTRATPVASASDPSQPNAVFETAVQLVASIGMHQLALGRAIALVTTTRQPRVASGAQDASGAPLRVTPAERERLLTALADVTQSGRPAAARELASVGSLRQTAHPPSAFAVLIEPSDRLIAQLTLVRQLSELTVAFLGPSVSTDEESRLGAAGWRCIRFSAGDDVSGVWNSAFATEAVA